MLSFLESDIFKEGLKLAAKAQPAIAPLSAMAHALTKSIGNRNKNIPVQEFYMGLDFENIPSRARLAEGSYIAVQIPEAIQVVWDWSEWIYNQSNGHVINKNDPNKLIPYNYIIFSISRYSG